MSNIEVSGIYYRATPGANIYRCVKEVRELARLADQTRYIEHNDAVYRCNPSGTVDMLQREGWKTILGPSILYGDAT